MNVQNCILPTYDVLNADQISALNENSFVVQHRKGEQIFKQDQPISHLMFIRSGLIKLYREVSTERSVILKISGPGSYIGMFSAFYGSRYQRSATALEDSETIYINMGVMRQVLSENGKYSLRILNEMSSEGIYLIDRMINFSQKQIPGRIAEILLFFSHEVYRTNNFVLPLSRQELADLVSSTKESISRTLTEFRNDRLIDIDDRKVELKSMDLLEILSRIG
jgi:CRP-like cAMP-binding protein